MDLIPVDSVKISPEALLVANKYLEYQDINTVAEVMGIGVESVSAILAKKEIQTYINQVFFDLGYNNRFKIRETMDSLIKKKLAELEEADIGSSKDILDILALSHKMTMDQMNLELQLLKQQELNIKNQTNIQINNSSNYTALLEKLLNSE
jgi:hypothetical protein